MLVVQALLFADGGLTALGLNVVNMAFVSAFGGYLLFLLLRRVLPADPARSSWPPESPPGLGVVLASLAFTVEYAIGGTGGASVGDRRRAMVGVHTLIGIGEGVITGLTVGAVLAVAARPRVGRRDLVARTTTPAGIGGSRPVRARLRFGIFAGVASWLRSARRSREPPGQQRADGLNKVAIDKGFADQEEPTPSTIAPTAGYGVGASTTTA